jgi:ankyrin repeat protein
MLFQQGRLYLAGRFGGRARHDALRARIERQNAKKNRLISAAYRGDADAVRRLLAAGARIDAEAKGGGTALTYAATRGHLEILQLLLGEHSDGAG